MALLTLAVALESAILAGFLVNHVDLSPNFGGAMMGVSNGLGNVMGIVAPLVVSAVVGDADVVSPEASQGVGVGQGRGCGWRWGWGIKCSIFLSASMRSNSPPVGATSFSSARACTSSATQSS